MAIIVVARREIPAEPITVINQSQELLEIWSINADGGGDGEGLVFEVVPTKVLSFSKSDGAATRHRFLRQ